LIAKLPNWRYFFEIFEKLGLMPEVGLVFAVQFDMEKFVNIDRDTPMLLPPDMRDWVPSNHLVHFMIDAIESVDTSMAQINHQGTGSEQYPPSMLLALLVYSYCTGIFSSRQIERSTPAMKPGLSAITFITPCRKWASKISS
jgi:hypothetical protein